MVFVTGGTGFLGTHLLRELVSRGEKVRALKRSTSTIFLEEEFSSAIEWVTGDVRDVISLQESMEGCDEVYHCASVVAFLPRARDRLMKTNVEGTANVVNAALEVKIRKLVHVSSVAAIGRSRGDEIINESTEWEEGSYNSNYAISKFLAEREVWRGIAEGLKAVIVNPSLIIGSGNWNEGPPEFFLKVWNGLLAYTSSGTGLVTAGDVSNIMIQLMKSDVSNERFIVNADHTSFKDFFFAIADELHVKRPYVHVKPWMMQILWRTEMMKYYLFGMKPLVSRETARIVSRWSRFDNTKIVNATGYSFTPIRESIKETAKKFLEDVSEGKIVKNK